MECTVSDFAGDILDYNELLPAGTTVVPVVSATVTEPHAVALIMQAKSVNGTAIILVTTQDNTFTKTYSVNFSLPTGIKDDIENQLRISMQDQKISIRSAGDIRFLQVSDIQGKLMFNRKVDSSETSVDTETWKSGVYIFKISTLNGVITKKISVIQ